MRRESGSSLLAALTPQIMEVLREIEQLESEWVIHDYSTAHSYGRIPGEKDIHFWSIPASTGLLLYSLIQSKKPKIVLEIGTSVAYSTIWIGAAVKTYGGKLYTIEICPEKLELARNNIKKSGLEDVVSIIHGDAIDVVESWSSDMPIDFLFLDADKENYLEYIKNLVPCMTKEAILCADNALDYRSLMLDFIAEVRAQPGYESLTMNMDNGILMMCPKA